MSNKSGIASQVLPLPSGGGALRGIGETFTPDPFTGTGNLSVPLDLPAGRNGFQPQVSLGYSTGRGNGPFGVGWQLSVPGVSRKTSKGVPRYRDQAAGPGPPDTFVLSGAEDLVLLAEEGGVERFRPRTEGLFARIERDRSPGSDVWRVRTRDGLVSHYGTPGMAGQDPAALADPANRARVFEWRLSETIDPFGSRIAYDYLQDASRDPGRRWEQLYPLRIRYVDHDRDGQGGFLVSVSFVYEERPDPFSDCRAGFEVRTRLRCRRIELRTHAGEDLLVRTYELAYVDGLAANGASLLGRIQVVGHDGDARQALPPLGFEYSHFEPDLGSIEPLAGAALPAQSLAAADLELACLFGNGLPDLVQVNGVSQFWRNLGGGRFAAPEAMPEVPALVHLADPGVQLADLNGDGRVDLLAQDLGGYFPQGFGGRWSAPGFVRYEHLPSVALEAPDVRLVDLDGDGVVDALRSGAQEGFELFFNHPRAGWERVETRPPLPEFPGLSLADPRVKLGDLNGDGLQDLVLVEPGQVDVWPYLGHGRWGARVRMGPGPAGLPPPGQDFDPRRVLLGDVDGDGLDDLIYVEPRRVTIWINQSGNGWGDPIQVEDAPLVTDLDAVRVADMLGGGTAGILWSADVGGAGTGNYRFLDLTAGVKPYLLTEMDNHRGAVTRVDYAPSTRFQLADLASPEHRWLTPLPVPVQVVAAVEVIDELSRGKLATGYRYHHGYWDGAERELRGFGMVEQLDTEDFEVFNAPGPAGDAPFDRVERTRFSPPLLTRTWFHLGPVGDEFDERHEADLSGAHWPGDPAVLQPPPATLELLRSLPAAHRADALRALRGRILRTELFAQDGTARQDRPYTVTETSFGIREVSPPEPGAPDRRRVFFPHESARRSTQWERGDEPMGQFVFTDDYDQAGQPRTQLQVACPRGWRDAGTSRSDAYLATCIEIGYAGRDDQRYIVDRVASRTTFEIVQGGGGPQRTVAELRAAVLDGSAQRRVIGQTVNHYDGEPFTGLALGSLGEFGALVRSERLVLTEDLIRAAYRSAATVLEPPEFPPYLVAGPPAWTAEYPEPFRDQLPPLAGYRFSAGDHARARGYFVQTAAQRYDVHDRQAGSGRGLVSATRDPLGRETTIAYDRFELFPVEVTDPAGLRTTAAHDYRALQPRLVTDPNGDRSAFAFSPLGLLERSAVMGKEGEAEGDTLQAPGTRLVYDFLAFASSPAQARQPVSVRTIRRVHHAGDDVPPAERDAVIETVEFSDGLGRLVQTRTRVEDVLFGEPGSGGAVVPATQGDPATGQDVAGRRNSDPQRTNVVVSGWQVHNNKGQVVERYEPFLSTGSTYAPPDQDQLGQPTVTFYEPRGRVARTVAPDGSEQRVVHGVPVDLSDPDSFEPTAWESHTYDANDNAGRTHPVQGRAYRHHWDTPTSIVLDALGRVVASVERDRAKGDPLQPVEESRTGYTYDLRGNLVAITDALGRPAFRYDHDLAGRPLRVDSIDAGVRRTVLDAAGNEIERRDSNGALTLQAYDLLQRRSRLWARDLGGGVTLRELLAYGDGGDPDQAPAARAAARQANRLGLLDSHHDEAGLLLCERYDFKGNLLRKARRVVGDEALLAVFPQSGDPAADWRVTPFRVDWQPPAGRSLEAHADRLLEPAVHETSTAYDALNRVTSLRLPADVDGRRALLGLAYNEAGALERVKLDDEVIVERIAYDARGRRTLVALGNGLMTRHAYDPRTFRLVRLRTERFVAPAGEPLTFRPVGAPLEALAFRYDLAGNILSTVERVPGCGVAANPEAAGVDDAELRSQLTAGDALVRRFDYDPRYRLVAASGRDCAVGEQAPPWADGPRCGFGGTTHSTPGQDNAPTLTRLYHQRYDYDEVDNLLRLRHAAGAASSTRRFTLAPGTNRLRTLLAGASGVDYEHDPNGNLTAETTSRHLEWDHAGQLLAFRTQAGTAEPSIHAQYLYDADGTRVRKLVRRQGGAVETLTSIDAVFEHHRWTADDGSAGGTNHVHVFDGRRRVALLRRGPAHPKDTGPAVQYHLGDHLGGGNLVVGGDGSFVNREEFTPYGESTFGGFGRKRYRFSGKERDEESGLSCHGVRHYAPWQLRWTSPDPLGPAGAANPYAYAESNPLLFTDPDGLQARIDLGSGISADEGQPQVVHSARTGRYTVVEGGFYVRNPVEKAIVEVELNNGDAQSLRQLDQVIKDYKVPSWAVGLAWESAGVDIRLDPRVQIMAALLGLIGGIGGRSSGPPGGGRAPPPGAGRSPPPSRPGPGQGPPAEEPAVLGSPPPRPGPAQPVQPAGATATLAPPSARPAGGGRPGTQMYRIGEGVRRSVAAREAGHPDVLAKVMGSDAPPTRIPLDQLLSPKAALPRDARFINVLRGIVTRDPGVPPIEVFPLGPDTPANLTPVSNVRLVKPRNQR